MSFSEDPTQGIEHGEAAGEDPAGAEAVDSTVDPTQGAEARQEPNEDPTQGGLGGTPYDDPTQGDELGSPPGEDPTAPAR